MMTTLLCQPDQGLVLGGTGAPKSDRTAASAVYARLFDFWGGWWWDDTKRPATEAERVRSVTPLGEPLMAARARYLLADLVRRGVIADLVVTAKANVEQAGYDLIIEYRDLVSGRPDRLDHFVPLI